MNEIPGENNAESVVSGEMEGAKDESIEESKWNGDKVFYVTFSAA